MAIPLNTTARQMETQARWLLASVVVIAMVLWLPPALSGWGAMFLGLIMVLLVWVMVRILSQTPTLPGHPIHAALVVPGALLMWHLAGGELPKADEMAISLGGAMEMSLLLQMGLFALVVVLVQSLLPRAALHAVTLGACGAAMMVAPITVLYLFPQAMAPMRPTLLLLGYAGVGVWLMPLWGIGATRRQEELPYLHVRERWLKIAILTLAAGMVGALVWLSPRLALGVSAVVGCVMVLAGLTFERHRLRLSLGGSVLAGLAIGILGPSPSIDPRPALFTSLADVPLVGVGERAMAHVGGADKGIDVLLWTIGPVGVGALVAGVLTCIVMLMIQAKRRRKGDGPRAVVWTSATLCATLALLGPAGLFSPAVTIAVGLMWGLLPAMLSRTESPRPGWWMVVAVLAFTVLMGLATGQGLATWSLAAITRSGSTDKWLHFGVGALLAISMAWMMGRRRVVWGVVGVVLAGLAGGTGEIVQGLATGRSVEMGDWSAHALGSGVMLGLYLLCMFARKCESPDVKSAEELLQAYRDA